MLNTENYLNRINYLRTPEANLETLTQIHEHHVFEIPFENIDVRYQIRFGLKIEDVYKKVVTNYRGGFCYELNLLFNQLLNNIGFTSHIISARILDSDSVGPEYDHMAVYVNIGSGYLADVGYGDLFIKPLKITSDVQHDGRNYFKIESRGENFLLSMSADGREFQKKYIFNLKEVPAEAFANLCRDKQINPESYFVKNTVCTKPTRDGRITIFNNKLIETQSDQRIETLLETEKQFSEQLKKRFGIAIKCV